MLAQAGLKEESACAELVPLAFQNFRHAALQRFQVGRLCFQDNLGRPVRPSVAHLDGSRSGGDGDDIVGGEEAREPFPQLVQDGFAVFIGEAVLLVQRDDQPLAQTNELEDGVAIDPSQVVVDNINHEVGAFCRVDGQVLTIQPLLPGLAEARCVRQQ